MAGSCYLKAVFAQKLFKSLCQWAILFNGILAGMVVTRQSCGMIRTKCGSELQNRERTDRRQGTKWRRAPAFAKASAGKAGTRVFRSFSEGGEAQGLIPRRSITPLINVSGCNGFP